MLLLPFVRTTCAVPSPLAFGPAARLRPQAPRRADPTLEAFLECDGSWTRCATRLHLHVNTLRYRVGRIEQLTSRDLSRLEDKLDFFLALRMS